MKYKQAIFIFLTLIIFSNVSYSGSPESVTDECISINHEYASAINSSDVERYSSVFTENAEFILMGNTYKGIETLRKRMAGSGDKYFTRLLITTVDIKIIDEDAASGITYFIMFQSGESGNEDIPIESYDLYMGEYHDNYRFTKDGCKFSRREVKALFMDKDN